jgi:hypothetical protein
MGGWLHAKIALVVAAVRVSRLPVGCGAAISPRTEQPAGTSLADRQ